MSITFETHRTCGLCGYIERGFLIQTCRVNKNSIRSVDDRGLGWTAARCTECGTTLEGVGYRLAGFKADTLAKINVWRARKGWEPWQTPAIRLASR